MVLVLWWSWGPRDRPAACNHGFRIGVQQSNKQLLLTSVIISVDLNRGFALPSDIHRTTVEYQSEDPNHDNHFSFILDKRPKHLEHRTATSAYWKPNNGSSTTIINNPMKCVNISTQHDKKYAQLSSQRTHRYLSIALITNPCRSTMCSQGVSTNHSALAD